MARTGAVVGCSGKRFAFLPMPESVAARAMDAVGEVELNLVNIEITELLSSFQTPSIGDRTPTGGLSFSRGMNFAIRSSSVRSDEMKAHQTFYSTRSLAKLMCGNPPDLQGGIRQAWCSGAAMGEARSCVHVNTIHPGPSTGFVGALRVYRGFRSVADTLRLLGVEHEQHRNHHGELALQGGL